MKEISYRAFFDDVTSTFRRYLFTQNFLPDGERRLREAFWERLCSEGVFFREPLLTTIPAYRASETLSELTREGAVPSLHRGLLRLARPSFDVTKPLYVHQVKSLGRAIAGQNLIVATGTGSGKTECFLLPILDDALRNPGPGVRAIVVYPLNALANDQLGR